MYTWIVPKIPPGYSGKFRGAIDNAFFKRNSSIGVSAPVDELMYFRYGVFHVRVMIENTICRFKWKVSCIAYFQLWG